MATNNASNEQTAASGKVLQGQGIGTASAYSTATYPSTATGTGTILRADGTNWSATTATYPNTAATGSILVANTSNTVTALAVGSSYQTLITNGTTVAWGSPFVSGNINGKTVTTTTLVTIGATNVFYCSQIIFRCIAASSISSGPTVSVGTNSSSFNNILGSSTLSTLTTANQYILFNVGTSVLTQQSNQNITLNVTAGATGTSQTLQVILVGVYA